MPGIACADGIFAGKIRVIDGDTFDVGAQRVRLFGIDAPEAGQPCKTDNGTDHDCGDWVTAQVRDIFQGKAARCEPLDRDRYGRTVARCYVADQDVGRRLVSDGLAYAYRRYAMDYDLEEKAALVALRGIHGFVLQSPAQHRLTRIPGRTPASAACPIKGNISKSGRIYHMPGQRDYDRTGIDEARGERWFCTEAEARAAGWRPSRS